MYCNTAIFAITPTAASVLSGGIVPLAQPARRISPRLQLGSDSITIATPGYYRVSGTVTLTVPVAGVVSLQLQKNGQNIPGIVSAESVTTATTQVVTIPIGGIIRVMCGETAVITLVNTGVAIDTSNVALSIERID